MLVPIARDDARLLVDRAGGLNSPCGEVARVCLYLFERDAAVGLLRSGVAALLALVPSKAHLLKGAVLQPRPSAKVRNGSFSLPALLVGLQISKRGQISFLNFNPTQRQLS